MVWFTEYVLGHSSSLEDKAFTCTFKDVDGKDSTLCLYLDARMAPKVNGKPVNFKPEKVFDCPYFSSKHGSGLVTIQKGKRKLVLDFRK